MRTKGSPAELEARRLRAGRLLRQGKSTSEVARLVGVTSSCVSKWKKSLRRRGIKGLKAKPHPGPAPRLSAARKRRLVAMLKKSALAAGYDSDLWTCRRVTVPAAALRTRDRPAPRHRLGAIFRIHITNIRTPQATEFLRLLDRHVQGPLIVVQDRLNVLKAAVKRWLAGRPPDAPRVMIEWLPPYAPALNPAEQLWNHGKRVDVANYAPKSRDDLRGRVRRSLIRQRCSPNLLASAFTRNFPYDHKRLYPRRGQYVL